MSTLTLFREPRQSSLSRHGWGGLFDSFFDDFTTFPRYALEKTRTHPTTKVNETETGYDVTLIVPGLNNEDFNVSLEGTTLTVLYEAKTEEDGGPMAYSSFAKSWTVPQGTTENDIHAQYKSGVLTLTVKKLAPDKPTTKSIPVQ